MAKTVGYVDKVAVYPFKSCAEATVGGEEPTTLPVSETGFEYDREWMVTTRNGKMVSQRTAPLLAKVAIDIRNDHLQVSVPDYGQTEAALDYDPDRPDTKLSVHQRICYGQDQGQELANFFSRFLGKEVRVMRSSRERPRYVDKPYRRPLASNQVAFGDGFPFLLTSAASLSEQHSNNNLANGTIPHERFRASIQINGPELKAYDEDNWRLIRIGSVSAYVVRACARCQIPSIIQSGERAGQKDDIDVLQEFLEDRRGVDLADPRVPSGRFFGQNLNHVKTADRFEIGVGDRVQVQFSSSEPNIRLMAA